MLKYLRLIIFIIVIVLIDSIFLISIYQIKIKNKEKYSTLQNYNYVLSNSKEYNKIIEKYLNEKNNNWLLKYKNDGKCFSKCEYFGELDNYVFVECSEECYTYTNNELILISGSLLNYRFLIKNGNVDTYDTPLDTEVYDESMHQIFSSKVVGQMYNHDAEDLVANVRKQAKDYFGL